MGLEIDDEEEMLEFTNNLGCDVELIVEGYQDMLDKGGVPADFGYFSPTIDIPDNAAAVCIQRDYIMNMTKKLSKSVIKKASTVEDFVLRMDI
jgi:hypothetical protein